jgi:hypothetical protein
VAEAIESPKQNLPRTPEFREAGASATGRTASEDGSIV